MDWISVGERLPTLEEAKGPMKYVISSSRGMRLAHFDFEEKRWWHWVFTGSIIDYYDDIIFWMPKPEPPSESEEDDE